MQFHSRSLVVRAGRHRSRRATAAGLLAVTMYAALSGSASASAGEPAAPSGLTAEVAPTGSLGPGDVQLTWDAPADDGGSAITDYVIQRSSDGVHWFTYLDGASTATTFTAHQLPTGVSQRFHIATVNSHGYSQWSDPIDVTPLGWPAAPESLVATTAPAPSGLSGEVALTWNAPTDTGGTAITDYVVERLDVDQGWTTLDDGVSSATTFTERGLTDGTSYTFRVAAATRVGTSRWTSTVTATPGGPPAPPVSLTAAAAPSAGVHSGEVQLSWIPPVAGAAISDYVIQYSADLGPWTPYRTVDDGESTATTHTVGGLIAGTHYAFHVAAVNATGVGWWSDTVEVTPRGEPAAPAGLNGAVAPAAGVGSGEVRLGWTAPDDDGGVPVTDYVVERSTDGTTWTPVEDGISTATTTTVGGLTNGAPYQLRAAAVNPVGQGPWSDVVLATPVWTPAGPASLGAASGIASGEVRLTWSVPIDDGGVPVTDYVVERSTDGTTWTSADGGISTATTTSVRGLTNGARYRFRVAAVNALGQGSWSESAIATPRWKPAAPRLRATAARSLQVKLTWTAPTSNGAPITDYVIQRSTGKRWTTLRDGISTARSLVITRLTDGVAYRFRVAAVNAVGRGLWSASVQATPRAG